MTSKEIISAFNQLSLDEKRATLSALESSWESVDGLLSDLSQKIEDSRNGSMACPYCKSAQTVRRGKYQNVQRFSCKKCGKWFRSSYGTAMYHIHLKDKWQGYLRCMEQGYSIRKAAKELGISIQTSFDWRHKILASLQTALPSQLDGLVECDDFQIAESLKGQRKISRKPFKRGNDSRNHSAKKVSVITAVSRTEGSFVRIVKAKKISSKEAEKALENRLAPGTTFITDEASSYNIIAEKNKTIIHKTINSKINRTRKPKGKIHLQTVNNQHKQLRDFLVPFNGVATKYLANYLNWFLYKQSKKDNINKVMTMLYTCLAATTAMDWVIKIIQNDVLIRT